jgi:choline kinase
MKAILLSAGQGSRLLPLTESCPKCLLPLGESTLLGWQIEQLAAGGVTEIVVIVGFHAGLVEDYLQELARPGLTLRTVFNPFYNVADNLASCWMARGEMAGDFLIVNGDTMFDVAVLEKLLASPAAPITLATDEKDHYDSDDMKVQRDGTRLVKVGKDLSPDIVDGESIGMILFRGEGPQLFADVLDQVMRTPNGLTWWYLKVIGILAERDLVETCSIAGLAWGEVDFPEDLENVQALFGDRA